MDPLDNVRSDLEATTTEDDYDAGERSIFRLSRGDTGFDTDANEQARQRLRREEPGLNRADRIRADPFPSGHTSRAWIGLNRHAEMGGSRMSRTLGRS